MKKSEMAASGSAVRDFDSILSSVGLHEALRRLNSRTPYRFTGVYRYDANTLRNVKLFDRWNPLEEQGADAPMQETFCAIVRDQGGSLIVENGRDDDRYPWMQSNPVVFYCGALLVDGLGQPFGTICHFDLARCESISSEIEVLSSIAPLVMRHLATSLPSSLPVPKSR